MPERYYRVAAHLGRALDEAYNIGAGADTVRSIVFSLADIYHMQDPSFDRSRFLRAAGVGI